MLLLFLFPTVLWFRVQSSSPKHFHFNQSLQKNWSECWDFDSRDPKKYKVHLSESLVYVFVYVSPEIKPLNKSFWGLIAMATMCINAKTTVWVCVCLGGCTEYLHGLECFPRSDIRWIKLYSFKQSCFSESRATVSHRYSWLGRSVGGVGVCVCMEGWRIKNQQLSRMPRCKKAC